MPFRFSLVESGQWNPVPLRGPLRPKACPRSGNRRPTPRVVPGKARTLSRPWVVEKWTSPNLLACYEDSQESSSMFDGHSHLLHPSASWSKWAWSQHG